jgi:murein DD-endopeptidase MepM/ murein hydrolase activator NlpD
LAAALAAAMLAGCASTGRTFEPPRPVPPPPAVEAVHVVQPGESLYRIAKNLGVDWAELARANGIADPTKIEVGQRLLIPGRTAEAPRPPPAPAPATDGGWAWPVDGPVYSRFGARGEDGWHAGIDITAPDGTPVRAARDGTVTFAGRQGRYGRLVVLEHGDGVTSWYAHLDEAQARVGRPVRRGDVIGTSGRSGNATGPHLHFEIRVAGNPVDPLPFLTTD